MHVHKYYVYIGIVYIHNIILHTYNFVQVPSCIKLYCRFRKYVASRKKILRVIF